MYSIDTNIRGLLRSGASEDMNVMAFPMKGRGQFRDVLGESADRDGMLRFPRQKGDSHHFRLTFPPEPRIRRLERV